MRVARRRRGARGTRLVEEESCVERKFCGAGKLGKEEELAKEKGWRRRRIGK